MTLTQHNCPFPVPGHFCLLMRQGAAEAVVSRVFDSHLSLARFVGRICRRWHCWHDADQLIAAAGPRGRSFDLQELMAFSRTVPLSRSEQAGAAGYVRRRGPVEGIGRRRHGRYFRRLGTAAERRLNGLVVADEDEPRVRAARCGHNLPSSWDDFPRGYQRSWKSQSKHRKSWGSAATRGANGAI